MPLDSEETAPTPGSFTSATRLPLAETVPAIPGRTYLPPCGADDAEPLIVNNPAGSGTLPEIWELEPAHAAAKSAFAGATDAPSVAGLAAEMRYGSLPAEALAIKPI